MRSSQPAALATIALAATLLRPVLLGITMLGITMLGITMLGTVSVTALAGETTTSEHAAEPASPPVTSPPVTVRLGVHHFPPEFIVSSHNGQPHRGGPGVERTRRILLSRHIGLTVVCVTPARMYLLLDKGELDLVINIKSTKALQQQQHQFAAVPYSELELMLYSHSRSSQAPQDNSVALIRGFDYQGQRQALSARGFALVDLPDAPSAVALFMRQRTQHLLTYQGPLQAYLTAQQQQLPSSWQVKKLAQVPTFYVISANSPHRQLLQQQLQAYARDHRCQRFNQCPP